MIHPKFFFFLLQESFLLFVFTTTRQTISCLLKQTKKKENKLKYFLTQIPFCMSLALTKQKHKKKYLLP